MRSLLLAAVAVLLALAAGCGGEESPLCESLGELEGSVGEVQDIELGAGALDELRESAADIEADLAAVGDAAGTEVGSEVADLEDSIQAIIAEIDAAEAEGELTRESLRAMAGATTAALADFDALRAAAPEC